MDEDGEPRPAAGRRLLSHESESGAAVLLPWASNTLGSRLQRVALRRLAGTCHDGEVQEVEIEGDMIRLGQLLKLSGLADSGAGARELLLASAVTVNGESETRRGRQLHRGDLVAVGEQTVRVV
jgi:ribosome-associated protein